MTAQYLFGVLAWEGVSRGFAVSVSTVEVSVNFEDSGNIVILGERDGRMKRNSMDNVR
jgi:hypothetical protein